MDFASSWMPVGGARNRVLGLWRSQRGTLLLPFDVYASKGTSLVECGRGQRRARRIADSWVLPAPVKPASALLLPSDILSKSVSLVESGRGGRGGSRRLFVPSDARREPLDVAICLRATGIAGCGSFSVVRSGAREGA